MLSNKALSGGCMFLLAVVSPLIAGEDSSRHDVTPAQHVGEMVHVEVLVEAEGKLKMVRGDKAETIPMNVTGRLTYDEKRLAEGVLPSHHPRSIRYYDQAEVTMKLDKTELKSDLSEPRRTILAECGSDGQTLFSPLGSLTRDELDLISLPASSLLIEGLLPTQPIAVDERWPIDADLLAALLELDAVGTSDVKARLVAMTERSAKFELEGTVNGAIDGVSTEMKIKAKYRLNLGRRHLDWLAIVIREKRSVGYAAPGVEAVARVQMKISPLESSGHFSDAAMEQITLQDHPELKRLRYRSNLSRVEFLYGRRWRIMGEESDRLTMRCIDRGELLAQCNVAVLPKEAKGKRLPLEKFQTDIRRALGESFGRFVRAAESGDEQGRAVYRVVVRGQASELPMTWIYRFVADREGNQVVFVVTAEEELMPRVGDADERLVESVRFVDRKIASAARPRPRAQ